MAELSQMTPEELATEGAATLKRKHEELGVLKAMQTGGYELVQEAAIPGVPVSPRPLRNAGFAFLGGLFLGSYWPFSSSISIGASRPKKRWSGIRPARPGQRAQDISALD